MPGIPVYFYKAKLIKCDYVILLIQDNKDTFHSDPGVDVSKKKTPPI